MAIHFKVLAWCIILILFDGYDLAVLGAIIPTLYAEWRVLLLASVGQSHWSFIAFSIPAFLAFVSYACIPEKKTKEYVSIPTEISIFK